MERMRRETELYWEIFKRTGSIHAFLAYLFGRDGIMRSHPGRQNIPTKAVKEISRPA